MGGLSGECTIDLRVTRESCAEIAQLRAEVVRANDWESRTEKLAAARQRLLDLGVSGTQESDPQLDVASRLMSWFHGGWQRDDVKLALVVLVAIVLELGSGLGLFVVTTPWRLRSQEGGQMIPGIIESAEQLGSVEDYASARITLVAGSEMTCSRVFLDYRRWCEGEGLAPLREGDFADLFDEVVRAANVEARESGGNLVYVDLGFEA